MQIAERLEVRIPQALQLRATRFQVELRRVRPQGHGQRVEGVRDAAVAPVEEEIAAVAEEDLTVVEVVVLDRLGNAVRGELTAHRLELGQCREHLFMFFRRQPAHRLRQHRAQLAGQHGKPPVGDSQREQLVRERRGRKLQLGIAWQRQFPMPQVGSAKDDLAEAAAGIPHQHPAALGVEIDELRDPIRLQLEEPVGQRGLEQEAGRDRLEVQIFVRRRNANHGRPPPDVELIELARHLGTLADPGLRLGEPPGLGPAQLRHVSGLTGNVGHAPWPARTWRQSPRSPLSRLPALPADGRGRVVGARDPGSRQRHRPDHDYRGSSSELSPLRSSHVRPLPRTIRISTFWQCRQRTTIPGASR